MCAQLREIPLFVELRSGKLVQGLVLMGMFRPNAIWAVELVLAGFAMVLAAIPIVSHSISKSGPRNTYQHLHYFYLSYAFVLQFFSTA
ncbi:unnamed protein product [Rhizophagus irregularis]|uniref:Uncharacterized protein n=1 Tax=Rhizophagus irregularis TaxID=588596 RepID=A0A915ZY62_9GLOM|nr:unnamed protein product [Rhizophagus irregularis]